MNAYHLCQLHFAANEDKSDILCSLTELEASDDLEALRKRYEELGGTQAPDDFIQDRLLLLEDVALKDLPPAPKAHLLTSTQLVYLLARHLAS